MSENKNIKELFSQIENKNEFILFLSHEFGVKPNSIRTNWFQTFFSVPDKHKPRVVDLLQRKIQQQNKIAV